MDTTPKPTQRPTPQDMRPIQFERGYTCHAEGSVLVSFGQHQGDLHREHQRRRAGLSCGAKERAG
jgi:hypothetical protein